ncbi:MAG: sulfotransferase [Acidobacteriota bacterium]
MSTRRNQRPIFLGCFSRGGSNILWNLFLSHPQVCSPLRETLEIFRLDWRAPTLDGFRLALRTGRRVFDQWNLSPRKPLGPAAARQVDEVLYREKLRTLDDEYMSWRDAERRYSAEEIAATRLCAKNNNGLVFLTELWLDLYPQATFFALLRHPVALYESHKRRRITSSPRQFTDFYNRIAGRMLDDAEGYDCCHLVRFEDLVQQPLESMQRLYAAADLDPSALQQLRFKTKPHYRRDGSHGSDHPPGTHLWLDFDEVPGFLVPDINRRQASQLEDAERRWVEEATAEVRERAGYE